ncbi:glycoside hydrolase [Lizonia empirigonia]|nr:glycoside hydrolase [Lizonia empirigonia]
MLMKTDVWLLAALYFGGAVDAAISSNYTEAILSSGTIKLGGWQDAFNKASEFVASLSTADKLSIITGSGAGNFTAGLAMSMTWDKDAINGMDRGRSAEFKGKGLNVAYAPTVQPLGRCQWGGRSGESYGPIRTYRVSWLVRSAKHYIMNEQETNRQGSTAGGGGMGGGMGGGAGGNSTAGGPPSMRRRQDAGNSTSSPSSEAYSVEIGDKAFHETYLAPFYDAVKAGVGAAMCSMQKINGSYGYENQDTVSRYLKVKLGFPGYIHPDAGAQHTGIDSANAGLDYGFSSYWSNSTIVAAIANGTFSSKRFDDMVIRQMMGYFKHNQESSYPDHAGFTDNVDYAADSIALLKNTNNALPLKNRKVISIFGLHAAPRLMGPNTTLTVMSGVDATMEGHMSQNGGSAMSSAGFLADGFMLKWWLNNTVVESSGSGMMLSDGSGTEISETTLGIADGAEACVVFLNAWAGEGGDRSELANAEGDYLVNTVADNCNNTIVVVNTVGPCLLDQWATHENVTRILYGGPLGQSSGHAINDVLFGDVNPSGKLIHTIAKNESDYDPNTQISEESTINFSEGNYIDYNVAPKTQLLSNEFASGDLSFGGREDLWDIVAEVSTDITNSGKVAGAEVAQLYVEFPAAADEPLRQLRGFHKASFQLRRRDLSVWNVEKQEWQIVRGDYKFNVSSSSRDLRVSGTITV